MGDRVVLDSSVIAPIFFPEENTGRVMQMLEDKRYITVDLAYAEVANVAWKRCMFSREDTGTTREALDNCITFITDVCDVIPARELLPDAFGYARTCSVTVYDALFLAASIQYDIPLLTLDEKVYRNSGTTGQVQLIR